MCQRVSVIRILLSAPHAKDPMLIVVNPYSKNQEKIAEYAPADIDSIVVWPRSNSAVRLTFVFLKKYGWAMKIDQSQNMMYTSSPAKATGYSAPLADGYMATANCLSEMVELRPWPICYGSIAPD